MTIEAWFILISVNVCKSNKDSTSERPAQSKAKVFFFLKKLGIISGSKFHWMIIFCLFLCH